MEVCGVAEGNVADAELILVVEGKFEVLETVASEGIEVLPVVLRVMPEE